MEGGGRRPVLATVAVVRAVRMVVMGGRRGGGGRGRGEGRRFRRPGTGAAGLAG